MPAPLREILASFTVKVDDKPLDNADKKINSAKENASGLGSALSKIGTVLVTTFAASAVKDFLGSQIDLGSAIKDTSDRLGVSTDDLQHFQYAAKLSGISGEEAAASLGHLNRSIGEALQGGEAAQSFAAIGVAIKGVHGETRPTLEVLSDLADHFKATDDPAAKTALAMKTLGRAGAQLIPVLNQGGDEIKKLFKEADGLGGVLGKDFIEEADKAGDQIDRFGFALEGVKAKVTLAVLPALTSLVTTFTDIAAKAGDIAKNTTLLTTGFYALGLALGVVAIATGIIDLEFVVMALSVIAIVAVVAILYLAFDDLYNLFTGNESVMGDVLDFFIGVGARKAEIDAFTKTLNDLGAAFTSNGSDAVDWGATLTSIAQGVAEAFIVLLRIITAVAEGIKIMAQFGKAFNQAGRDKKGFGEAVSAGIDATDTAGFKNAFRALPDFGAKTGGADLDRRVTEQKVENTFHVNVDAQGKDGKQIGQDIVTGAQSQIGNRPKNAATAYGGGL